MFYQPRLTPTEGEARREERGGGGGEVNELTSQSLSYAEGVWSQG